MSDWDMPPVAGLQLGGDFSGGDSGADRRDDNVGGDGERLCRQCNQPGHMKRDCPEIPEEMRGPGACYSCGEIGHNKADCPNKPADVCRNCKEEGHITKDCTNNRKLENDHVPTMEPNAAWAMVENAAKERDLDDLREALAIYVKALPDTTFEQLEKAFRSHDFKVYMIAYEKELANTYTNMDLQGKLGMKYTVGLFFSPKPQRATLKEGWPPSPEDNLERLNNAGFPVETRIPRCNNCGEVGHTSKGCKQDRVEPGNKVEVRCFNCEELGHRPRDCPKPRPDRYACKNCGQRGHNSKECPEPCSAANVECKNCGKMGHFGRDCPEREPELCRKCGEEGHRAKDCPNPQNPDLMVCRNCDEKGHAARECPHKKDWSRVKCQNCGEMGHGRARCPQPKEATDDADFGGGMSFGGTGGDFAPSYDEGTGDAPPAATEGEAEASIW